MGAYEQVQSHIAEVNDILNAVNLLTWDSRVCMPASGASARANQLATLTGEAHRRLLDEPFVELVRAAREELGAHMTDLQRRTLDAIDEAIAYHSAVPPALVTELALLKGRANQAWLSAREADDFESYAPVLEELVQLKRQLARLTGDGRPLYDALLHEYEPGMTSERLLSLFAEIKGPILDVISNAAAESEVRTDFLSRSFDIQAQKEFALEVATKFGYRLENGRADTAPHPFEISLTPADVRITTRYDRNNLPMSLFAMWHEAGHGMYEQGAATEHIRTAMSTDLIGLYAVAGTSYSMHEAQSRLWENFVSRSATFWDNHFPELQAKFPEQLHDVSAAEFYRAVNKVQASPIRIQADEVSYHLHIMLRAELEIALLEDELTVTDLPGAWREKTRDYLGLELDGDRLGVLQDIHWAAGLFGSFPTYTLGTLMAAQLFEAAVEQKPEIRSALEHVDYVPLFDWLSENIYQHARMYSSEELLLRTSGRPLEAAPFLRYLAAKHSS